MKELQKAAQGFMYQGDDVAYQKTLKFITTIQGQLLSDLEIALNWWEYSAQELC